MKNVTRTVMLQVLISVTTAVAAWADTIALQWRGNTEINAATADTLQLTGSYSSTNEGNAAATNLYVRFELGNWRAEQGPLPTLLPHTAWQSSLRERIPVASVGCLGQTLDLCAGLELPARGFFPLRIRQQYHDRDGYEFSAIAVQQVEIGNLTADERGRRSPIELSVIAEHSQRAVRDVTITATNTSSQTQLVSISLVVSDELSGNTDPLAMTIRAHEVATRIIQVTNLRMVGGTNSLVVAIAQGAEGGLRYLSMSAASFAVAVQPPPTRPYVVLLLICISAAAAALYGWMRFWFWPLSTTVPR